MNSRLFDGETWHSRIDPVPHSFRYPLHYFCFDLAELEALSAGSRLFGYNRRAIVSLHDRDYLFGEERPLEEALRDFLRGAGVTAAIERIELITVPRHFGYVFNPVSFWYCHGADGRLVCAVAEVNSTFGERHLYLLDDSQSPGPYPRRFESPRVFHVSPFNDMHGEYHFVLKDPAEELAVAIDIIRDGRTVFRSGLRGVARPFTDASLARLLIRHPVRASLTMPRILAQAAKLYFARKLPVFTRPAPASTATIRRVAESPLERWCARQLESFLSRAQHGRLALQSPDGSTRIMGDPDAAWGASLRVHEGRFYTSLVFDGDIGLGEAFERGDWSSPDPTAVLQWFIANRDLADDRSLWTAVLGRLAHRASHLLRANSLTGSRRNIREHYDLGNEFFRLFLDPTLAYSCALFSSPEEDLEAAQRRKLARMAEIARIEADHHVLEIGSGWGTFAIETAQRTGCRVTTITLSEEQFRHVTDRVRALGLEGRVTPLLRDYREMTGTFDRIVSIEMLEAVGHENLPTFFSACDRLLAPNGLLALQVITMPDHRYESYRRSCDWIQKYIFPGAVVPSVSAITSAAATGSKLQIEAADNIGPHYAETLRRWRDAFRARHADVLALGFPPSFLRRWEYYLSYCEAGFATGTLGTMQLLMSRPCNTTLLTEALSATFHPGGGMKVTQ